jgi:hypothetical protein
MSETAEQMKQVSITAPNFQSIGILITGTAPYVQNKFSSKAMQEMKDKQEAGSVAAKGKKRQAKDFQDAYKQAIHISHEGWYGIPAPAFRNAMISACRVVGFKMTLAKLSVFVEADGFDKSDGTPLVKIVKGDPEYFESLVRIQSTVDIRPRPMWQPGWKARVRITYDGDQFTAIDIANLMMRVGMQVGIGEGRPDSKDSTGMGWGHFSIETTKEDR